MENLEELQALLNDETENRIDELSKSIESEYLILIAALLNELRKLYNKYSKDGKLTYNEMKKYKRLSSFKTKINELLDGFYNKTYTLLDNGTLNEYKANFEAYRDYIEMYEGIDSKISTPSNNDMRDILIAMLIGMTIQDILQKNKNDLMYSLTNQLNNGLSQEMNITQMQKGLKTSFDRSFTALVNIKDWQMLQMAQKGSLDVNKEIQDKGIAAVTKTWNTQRDKRVRNEHKKMEGKTVGIDVKFTMPDGTLSDGPRLCANMTYNYGCRCFLTFNYK